ncbi:MAG: hypothetical protein ABL921_27885, partial [Pirellula sp.]
NSENQSDEGSPTAPQADLPTRPDMEKWFASNFHETNTSRLYELVQDLPSPLGSFCGVVDSIAGTRSITLVINHAQLDPEASEMLRSLRNNWGFHAISQSLWTTSQVRSAELWQVINAMLHQDALICLISNEAPNPQVLVEYANSLGYPSLFGRHISNHDSSLRRYLVETNTQAVFEWNKAGKVYLLR